VNQTIQINIPVSDANAGDDVRCRWANYTSGYRRRRRSSENDRTNKLDSANIYREKPSDRENIYISEKYEILVPMAVSMIMIALILSVKEPLA
jgi:hypothetical protein